MSNNVNIVSCNHATFTKYLEENKLKEQNFKEMFEQLNEKYVALSKDIIQLNEQRSELLFKIKSAVE